MTIAFSPYPIPVTTIEGDGHVIYVKDSGRFDNDEWCVAMLKDGSVKHFLSNQIRIWHNETLGIKKENK